MKPVLFMFDDPSVLYEGFAHGSTWNGFDNVAVTAETLAKIRAAAVASDGPDFDPEYYDIAPMKNGLYSLGWGFAAQIVEPNAICRK